MYPTQIILPKPTKRGEHIYSVYHTSEVVLVETPQIQELVEQINSGVESSFIDGVRCTLETLRENYVVYYYENIYMIINHYGWVYLPKNTNLSIFQQPEPEENE